METDAKGRKNLRGMTLDEVRKLTDELRMPSFAALQICKWLYDKRVDSIEKMTNLSVINRSQLSEKAVIEKTLPTRETVSQDGTKKYLFSVRDSLIEAAYIPDTKRETLCVSSQAGCRRGCQFCMTARQGFQIDLTSGEILNQILTIPESESLTNLVYMGMGEPLDNVEEVLKSLTILTSSWGLNWPSRKITLSTVGILPGLERFLNESDCALALSIHSPFEEERRKLMPVETTYPLKEVLKVLKEHEWKKSRRFSVEYILFEGLNDSFRHADELVKILNGLRVRVNLITFHPIPGSSLKGSPVSIQEQFRDRLNKKGITATIRRSRGEDIEAACGLLSTKERGVQ